MVILITNSGCSDILSVILNVLSLYGISHFLLHNRHFISGITAVLSISIMQLSFGLFNSIAGIFLPYLPENILLGIMISVFTAILSLFWGFLCYSFIIRYLPLKEKNKNQYIFLLLAPTLLLFSLGLYVIHTAYGSTIVFPIPIEFKKHMELLILQLLSFFSMFSTLYAYGRMSENFKMEAAMSLLKQEAHAQKNYVAEAKLRYERTRAFRHDIKNHLSVLNGLLKIGTIKQAQEYLKQLDFVTNTLSFPIHTNNPIVDIILCDKLSLIRQHDVKFEATLSLPQTSTLEDLDLCVIFSNAVDNAIHACTQQSSGIKYIHILGERQGDFYMLEFKNTCSSEQAFSAEKVGTGLSNIETITKKYGGAITIESTPSSFCLNVLLNISLPPDDIS